MYKFQPKSATFISKSGPVSQTEALKLFHSFYETRLQGWRNGESARLPPMWPSLSPPRCHMWVELVAGSHLALRVFLWLST